MRNKLLLTLLCSSILLFSCKKDEDDDSTNSNYTPSYLNQNLQGKIDGGAWELSAGNVNSGESFSDSTKISHFFTASDTSDSDSCLTSYYGSTKILFSIEDANELLSVGSHKLKLEFNSTNNKTVTFYTFKDGTSYNWVATKGAYEILSVDTAQGLVTGRMDVEYDKNNYVNGNFTMKYCSW